MGAITWVRFSALTRCDAESSKERKRTEWYSPCPSEVDTTVRSSLYMNYDYMLCLRSKQHRRIIFPVQQNSCNLQSSMTNSGGGVSQTIPTRKIPSPRKRSPYICGRMSASVWHGICSRAVGGPQLCRQETQVGTEGSLHLSDRIKSATGRVLAAGNWYTLSRTPVLVCKKISSDRKGSPIGRRRLCYNILCTAWKPSLIWASRAPSISGCFVYSICFYFKFQL